MKKSILEITTAITLLTGFVLSPLNANTLPSKHTKPFLIQGKLPHLSKQVKMMWEDSDFALTKVQKKRLLVIRKDTMSQLNILKKKINILETEIVQASNDKLKPQKIKEKVYKLSQLKAKATMIHLKCIYKTRNSLTQAQLNMIK